jgi:hypothetical protein
MKKYWSENNLSERQEKSVRQKLDALKKAWKKAPNSNNSAITHIVYHIFPDTYKERMHHDNAPEGYSASDFMKERELEAAVVVVKDDDDREQNEGKETNVSSSSSQPLRLNNSAQKKQCNKPTVVSRSTGSTARHNESCTSDFTGDFFVSFHNGVAHGRMSSNHHYCVCVFINAHVLFLFFFFSLLFNFICMSSYFFLCIHRLFL